MKWTLSTLSKNKSQKSNYSLIWQQLLKAVSIYSNGIFVKKTTFSVNEREKIELHLRSIKNLVDLVQDRFYEICITYFSSLKLRKERVQNSRHWRNNRQNKSTTEIWARYMLRLLQSFFDYFWGISEALTESELTASLGRRYHGWRPTVC